MAAVHPNASRPVFAFAFAFVVAGAWGCRREPASDMAMPNPGQWGGAPTAPPSPGPVATVPPAVGFVCSSDADLQCPFARCVGSRCGGCRGSLDCKPGSSCGWTPFGMACVLGGSPAPTPPPAPPVIAPPSSSGGDPFEGARRTCLEVTNRFRARVALPALVRNVAADRCVDGQAKEDGERRQIHGAFGRCGELAQNECPAWDGRAETMVERCLVQMFDEGPGSGPEHGHYRNIMSPQYTNVSCGFFVTAEGRVWMVQDFFR